jgi:hypothetical protein
MVEGDTTTSKGVSMIRLSRAWRKGGMVGTIAEKGGKAWV